MRASFVYLRTLEIKDSPLASGPGKPVESRLVSCVQHNQNAHHNTPLLDFNVFHNRQNMLTFHPDYLIKSYVLYATRNPFPRFRLPRPNGPRRPCFFYPFIFGLSHSFSSSIPVPASPLPCLLFLSLFNNIITLRSSYP